MATATLTDWTMRVAGDPERQEDGYEVYDRATGEVDSWHRWATAAERRMHDLRDAADADRLAAMTEGDRGAMLGLILDAAGPSDGPETRDAAIARSAREFCRAFPSEAAILADAIAADYASRDQSAPRDRMARRPLPVPSGRVDEPIVVAF